MIVRSFPLTVFIAGLLVTNHSAIAQDAAKPRYVQGEHLIVAQVSGSNDFLAYSKATGKWTKHTFPDGVTAVPVMGRAVCAFSIAGDKITEIVAVDRGGNWRSFKLSMATATKCVPIVSDTLAVYTVDGQAHAFRAVLGKWHTVAATATAAVSKDTAMIITADRIAVFSAVTAKWAVADTKKKDN